VVLVDLKMPGLDGDDVLSLIKSMSPSPKVIFITAYDDGGKTKARLLSMGAYACLDKPIPSLKDLEEMVNKAANT
jgi:CheY-like chemotaxis protein